MSTNADLMGLGMPAELANRLGNNIVNVTTAGTTSGTATLMKGGHTYVLTTAASQTGGILSGTESIGDVVFVTNTTATGAVIYPPSGATFNTAASTSLAIAQYATNALIRLSATLYAVLL